MPAAITDIQGGITWALLLGGLVLAGFAFFDAVRSPAQAFTVAGKQTKNVWLAILGISLAVIFAFPLLIAKVVGVVAAAVYMVDVRPAVRQSGRGRGPQEGPYGPW